MSDFSQTMLLSLKVAALSTAILLVFGIFLGYFLANHKSRFTPILEAIICLPLVLPPSVLGFYLLVLFSPNSALGGFLLEFFNIKLVFSFAGIVLASVIFSLPFVVLSTQAGFSAISTNLKDAAKTLGKNTFEIFFFVLLPNAKNAILRGAVLAFAHTIGEFGVVMMIGGNIAGQTRVASIAIYDEVESLNYAAAHEFALALFLICFFILLFIFWLNSSIKHKSRTNRVITGL